MQFSLKSNCEYEIIDSLKPNIKGKENLIKIKACGICGSDIPRVFMNKSYYYPIVLGHEFSGIIEDSYDKSKISKKVCIFPIRPCFKCENCKNGNYANCVHYNYYGSRCDGGMQDYIVADDFNIIEIPESISYDAAAMVEPCAVTLHALKKANIEKGQSLKVYGAGTIGLICCMWAKSMGVEKICVVDTDDKKLEFAKSLGFENLPLENPDVVIDASGAMQAVNDAIKSVKAFGKIILLGNASKDMTLELSTYSQILRKQLILMGSWNSDYKSEQNDWLDVVKYLEQGIIHPEKLITHRYGLKDSAKAFDMIKERKETFNKIMLEM